MPEAVVSGKASSAPLSLQDESENLPKLHTFPAKEVADEMTLLDARLLRLIKSSELEDGVWMKKDKVFSSFLGSS